MKLNLTEQDLQLIRDAEIPFDVNKDYDFWGLDEILEQVYDKEIDYAQAENLRFADLYAHLADKIEDQRAVVYGR